MSTALENEDRDFVTEDDLRAGNELVWVKNNNRLTVRVARAEAGYSKVGFFTTGSTLVEANLDDYEECNATLSDELRRIRIAVEGILNHLISNTGNSVPTPNCQLTPSTTLTCDPPSTSKEAQAESQSKPINQSPEYFVNKNGVDLLKVRGTNVVKYALGLLDALYTEEELKQSSFVPVGKSTTSVKPPLSPERMKLFEGKIMGMILGQGGKIMGMILGQGDKILGMILGEVGKILGMILGQGGKILDKILGMILVHGSGPGACHQCGEFGHCVATSAATYPYEYEWNIAVSFIEASDTGYGGHTVEHGMHTAHGCCEEHEAKQFNLEGVGGGCYGWQLTQGYQTDFSRDKADGNQRQKRMGDGCYTNVLMSWDRVEMGAQWGDRDGLLNIGPFRICSNGEFHDTLVSANPGCLASYRFCLFLFALIVVPLSCLELKELGFIQAILGIARFTTIVFIILYCLAKLAELPLIEHTIPSYSTFNQSGPIINTACSSPQASPRNFVLDFSVVGWVLSIPVFTYAQMLHPGIPSLTHPIKQKKGLHWFMAAIFGTTLVCYTTLGIVVSLWFRGDINETASLNWVIMGRDGSKRKHSYDGLILVAMRAVVAILPIVCSLFISNLVYILKYGGLVGFLTAFFFPLALQLASQYKCVKVFGKELAPAAAARGTPLQPHVDTEMEVLKKDGEEEGVELTEGSEDESGRGKAGKKGRSPPACMAKAKLLYMTPYSIPGLSHPVAMVMTGLLGGATFVIALVSLAYSVEPKCP
eukprot:Em0003g827a